MSRAHIILGSSSPRRRELLRVVGLSFEVLVPGTDEIHRPGEAAEAYTLRNAREKAEAIARLAHPRLDSWPSGCIIICADTIVVLTTPEGEAILEKPRDAAHAHEMLASLSGRTHTVYSGVAMCSFLAGKHARPAQSVSFAVRTDVTLKHLSPAEIAAYVATGEPLDKAGAYAAQGIGSYMVRRIEGSYANVVGLPIAEVVDHLERTFTYPLWSAR